MPISDLTTTQARAAREIVALARRDRWKAGTHLPENALAKHVGTSRSPVNVALKHLAVLGMLSHDDNRGYFLSDDAERLGHVAQALSTTPDDPLYLQLADDRLGHRWPDAVNESDLMRTYGVARSTLRKVMSRAQEEGWVEKAVGHGWAFLPMIDSAKALSESYAFRASVEPAALLSPSFVMVPTELESLRRQQAFIAAKGWKTMTPMELFEANSQFHETLARWSDNRFVVQAVRRTNQLRRLMEYREARVRQPRQTQAKEHLRMLDTIEAGNTSLAATQMRDHLDGARRIKLRVKSSHL